MKFDKNKNPSKPEQVCSEITQGQALDITLSKNKHEILADILNISKVIREEIRTHEKWKFTGTFSTFKEPNFLSTLVKWILIGPNEVIEHKTRRKIVENSISIVTQLIMQSFKTKTS